MPFIKDGVGYIPLQKSRAHKRWFALVDLEDYERVSHVKWFGSPSGRTIYVRATSKRYLPQHHMALHRLVLNVQPGDIVDHINGNGLDNRRANLRLASVGENSQNSLKTDSRFVTSKFKGVIRTSSGRWAASITVGGDFQSLGLFDDEAEAARTYDAAALARFGEFAKTNAAMGLYETEEPVRDLSGWRKPGEKLGEFQSRESLLAQPESPPWAIGHLDNPDRAERDPVVGAAVHKRTKKWLYRLKSGRTVPTDDYLGQKPSTVEFARMKREYTEAREARRAGLAA